MSFGSDYISRRLPMLFFFFFFFFFYFQYSVGKDLVNLGQSTDLCFLLK